MHVASRVSPFACCTLHLALWGLPAALPPVLPIPLHELHHLRFGGLALHDPLDHALADKVAAAVPRHPLDVRLANLYNDTDRTVTPYGMTIEDNVLPQLMPQLAETSDYRARRAAIIDANASAGRSPVRRGIALTPVRFGISFTTSFLNQAGALINIYKDGSILLNHGGTEMGPGVFVKVAQVAAEVLGVRLEDVWR